VNEKIEVAFHVEGGRTVYMDMIPEALPSKGDAVVLSSQDPEIAGLSGVVTSVFRTYDVDAGELFFGSVLVEPAP
jgi:hypothetical protein